ncbi:hypothetical protein FO519_006513 [Halicephalobus sp. NKZ332]|nr:hypothetical protein FO519_006513 [Halicephalobus sp. NKZ332]
MALLSFAVLCISLIAVHAQDPLVCPPGALSSIDKSTCYNVIRTNKTFIEAESYCVTFSGHLCSFHNAFDNMIVNDYARNFLGVNSTFFIGGNDLMQTSQWQWTDGSDFDYDDFEWKNHQTNNKTLDGSSSPHTDCAQVSTDQGVWKKVNCYNATNVCCIVPKVIPGTTVSPMHALE